MSIDSISKYWMVMLGAIPTPPDTQEECHANCENYATLMEKGVLVQDNWIKLKCGHKFHVTCMGMLRACLNFELKDEQCPICHYPHWEPYPSTPREGPVLRQWLYREPTEMFCKQSRIPYFRYDDLLDLCLLVSPGTIIHTTKALYMVLDYKSFALVHLDYQGALMIPQEWVNKRGAPYYDRIASFHKRAWVVYRQ